MNSGTKTSPETPRTDAAAGPTLKPQRVLALILLICQAGITFTGAIVRVTGSGLGCVTWPQCHPGSLLPEAGAAPMIHQAIEFGNRLLTFVLVAAAAAVMWALYKAGRRSELKTYGWINVAGIVIQALIGALSVKLKLSWWSVALHFLPSMILVWVAALLYIRITESDEDTPTVMFPKTIRTVAALAATALSIVLITGTFVTGSGTHSGDDGVGMEERLGIDTYQMAVGHAVCMYIYLALTITVVFLLYRNHAARDTKRIGWVLIGCIIAQWIIGVSQYYLHIPSWTVPFHVLMSSVVTTYTAFLWAQGVRRLPAAEAAVATAS
ncbi:heme A synthase [Corynebacterium sp.]|uniref:COX15/CtaA family protein n=1 Tax=Corynebacterium sp. TaxID=1720 RepID=UPI0026DD6D13|nr:heme A synthase [Corynebacterium sp.]MDO5031546.1 heme A synthase [Corynebacterium sp.]